MDDPPHHAIALPNPRQAEASTIAGPRLGKGQFVKLGWIDHLHLVAELGVADPEHPLLIGIALQVVG